MADIFNMLDTWNASGTVFTGIKLSVTDTASASGSLLMDLQVGGGSRFSVSKSGNIRLGSSATKSAPNFAVSSDTGLYVTGSIFGYTSGNYAVVEYNAGWKIYSGGNLGFTSGEASAALDTILTRDAANTLAQRNGVNAQAFNLYQSYTDASNYTRGRVAAASGIVTIAGESAGTGATDIDIALTPKGTGRVRYGTHAAIAAETVTGYIEIKDAGGTVRKIAVVS